MKQYKNLGQLIARLRPGAEFQVLVHKDNEVVWKDKSQTMPTEAELDAEVLKLEAENQARLNKEKDKKDAVNEIKSAASLADQVSAIRKYLGI